MQSIMFSRTREDFDPIWIKPATQEQTIHRRQNGDPGCFTGSTMSCLCRDRLKTMDTCLLSVVSIQFLFGGKTEANARYQVNYTTNTMAGI